MIRTHLRATLTTCLLALFIGACADPSETPAQDMSANPTTDMDTDQPAADMDPSADMAKGCPQAQLFLQPVADPANSAYPAPQVEASCTETELLVKSNGIIGYPFVQITPNDLQAQSYNWKIPLTPKPLETPVDVALLGTIGVSVNGIPLFGPNEAERPDPYGDPIYNAIVDECLGHTAMRGTYHYHALVEACIVARASAADEPSPIIGYAFDGYAIYGSKGCKDAACAEVVTFKSGWKQTGDPSTYAWDNHAFEEDDDELTLDKCNGHTGPKGDYHYHATATFPYILGCHHGEPTGR